MTAPGRYAASDGSFAKSTGNAAARGGVLIAVAALIGILLLWQGFDGDDPVAGTNDPGEEPEETEETPSTEEETPGTEEETPGTEEETLGTEEDPENPTSTEAPAITVDNPSAVRVAVLNASGVSGQAGLRTDALEAEGYVAQAGNAAENQEDSTVYYKPEYADEAKVVADFLAGAAGGASALEPITQDASGSLGRSEGDQTAASEVDIIVVLGIDGALA